MSIRYGGSGPVIARGDVSIEYGGTQALLAGGRATIGPRALVGFVVSPAVTVEEGGKVLMSTPQALAFGAALGALYALVNHLVKR